VFLDEIGEMTPGLQAKLLRFLEEKTFKRVGRADDLRVDVRVVAATNRDLEDEVAGQRFREDLFYRLQVMPVTAAAAARARGDIPLLVDYYIDRYNREFRRRCAGSRPTRWRCSSSIVAGQRPRAAQRDRARHAAHRSRVAAAGRLHALARAPHVAVPAAADGVNLEEVERQLLVQALERAGGNQTQAGQLLGINRDQVRYRIEKFGLARPGQERSTSSASVAPPFGNRPGRSRRSFEGRAAAADASRAGASGRLLAQHRGSGRQSPPYRPRGTSSVSDPPCSSAVRRRWAARVLRRAPSS
jgi:DNA-binding NtrC family response regulator